MQDFKQFATQWIGVVVATLAVVVFTAFVSVPWQLERHPGEAQSASAQAGRHMT